MQHLVECPKKITFPRLSFHVRAQVRFLAYHRIKPHAPPLVRAPVNSFEFQSSDHRLRRGLPGYLILFDPHAFVHERQLLLGKLPSRSVFCVISKHFTAT